MLQMVLKCGGSALPAVLVIPPVALLQLIIRRSSFSSGRLRDPKKTGKLNSTLVEQFAGISQVNSCFHNRIKKEQYL